jgi:hypothetical protein
MIRPVCHRMITVAQRVMHAIDGIGRGEYEYALEDAAVAIDISAQRHAGKSSSGRSDYKAFLEQYFWVIELMALNGIDLQKSVFENLTIEGISAPKLPDLIYHVVRCGLVHSTGLPPNLVFVPGRVASFAHEHTSLPAQMIWGLLAIVVFAKVNASEKSVGDYFFNYEDSRFLIRDNWGKEDLLRTLYDKHVKVRVALNIRPFPKP